MGLEPREHLRVVVVHLSKLPQGFCREARPPARLGEGGQATLEPESWRSRARPPPGARGPSPGKPSPRPRPLLAGAAPTPQSNSGRRGCRHRGDRRLPGRWLWVAREKRWGRLSWVAPNRCRESDFSFAPPLLLQSLRDLWKREGTGPHGQPLEGALGGRHCLTFFAGHRFLRR